MDVSADPTPVGVASSQSTKRKAESTAMAQCKARGGKACKVRLAYHNQCAVIAWGDGGSVVQSAASTEIASGLAMKLCQQDGDAGCRIWYSDCSMAKRVE